MNWKRRSPVSSDYQYEEEDFDSKFNGNTLARIIGQVKPHWRWVLGFMVCVGIVSILDAYFTYLGKRIIDDGILKQDVNALTSIAVQYFGLFIVLAGLVFGFIYLAGILGWKVRYELRKKIFNHIQTLSF